MLDKISFFPRLSFLSYDGTGSLNDRLITALYVIVAGFVLTLASLYIPYGRFISVATVFALIAMAVFELVRLFARRDDTLAYRPIIGAALYTVIIAPGVMAAVSAVNSVLTGVVSWSGIYLVSVLSAEALMLAMVLEGRNSIESAERFAGRYGVGFILASIAAPALIIISGLPRGIAVIWWIVGCAALNDTAAYLVGRACGRHKMAQAISPNKTIEGSLAGLVVGTIVGVFLWRLIVECSMPILTVALLSLSVTIAAQVGDLTKSYLKRLRGVKDFGALLPGHGGVLDRFDALIAAAPVVLGAIVFYGLV